MTASLTNELAIKPSSLCFENCVLFGGTGFIGTHFARFLLTNNLAKTIMLADIEPPNKPLWSTTARDLLSDPRVRYVPIDVCVPIAHSNLPERADLVLNFAAIHREPGHEAHEYFETNLNGAENVCQWAESVGCNTIVFTSSISPYGPTESEKNEQSIPVPVTAYGASKLAAEKIHLAWQRGGRNRKLVIVRPGVVFGPGEGGNVSRLVRSVIKGYFFYAGNQNTRKAGGYVKELCNAIVWVLKWQQQQQQNVTLFNFSADPTPTLEEYVSAVCKVAEIQRTPLKVPYLLLLSASYPIAQLAGLLGLKQPIDPVRIRKLVRSNNIVPDFLRSAGYPYQYTLEQALEDWRQEKPEDWT
ncbi:NAD-dependent epimerase/dehydratase family protein [Altericista sp. CCNU0014]|uniref:NAD-dependent epimerase/dehydratase family protein n=1 Tax=Altericista sp. CCNU0014 TaxID=3082949 RepID=UPI00384A61B9